MNTKKTWVSLAVLAACLVGFGGLPARAQSKMQVYGGYSFGTNSCFGSCYEDPGLQGYTAAFTYNFNRHIGLEANFSGHNGSTITDSETPTSSDTGYQYKVGQNIYVYTFGPRFTLPLGNFALFSHVLVGASYISANETDSCIPATGTGEVETCGSNDRWKWHGDGFASKFGGGVDWNHKNIGIRILEVDYIHGQLFTTEDEPSCAGCGTYKFDASGNAFEMSAGLTFNFGGMN